MERRSPHLNRASPQNNQQAQFHHRTSSSRDDNSPRWAALDVFPVQNDEKKDKERDREFSRSSSPESSHSVNASSPLLGTSTNNHHAGVGPAGLGHNRRQSIKVQAQRVSKNVQRSFGQHFRSRRVLAIIATLSVGACFVFGTDTRSVSQLTMSRCEYMPWLQQCGPVDPFDSLEYERKDGFLFFPATLKDQPPPKEHERMVDQPHPIHLLIREGEQKWAAKLAKQSQTFQEAVQEYRKRYNMAPPRGFDKWYEFAKKRGVQLIDEYDSILDRILPFASLPRDVLKQRSEMLQHDKDFWMHGMTFTIKVRDGGKELTAEGPMRENGARANQVMDLLAGFSQFLPDLNLTMTGHDTPWVVIAGEAKIRHLEAAKAEQYIAEEHWNDFAENGALDGWTLICPPHTPIRHKVHYERRSEEEIPNKTAFIDDHVASMDLCTHPERQGIHGFTAWPGPRPGLLFPLFTFTSTSLHSDILVPPLEQYEREVGPDPLWKDKVKEKIVWRGSTTGSDLAIPHMRKYSQRPRLCRMNKQSGSIGVPIAPHDEPGKPKSIREYLAYAFDLADDWFDFKFMGRAQQCGDENSCKNFEAEFEWDEFMSNADQNQYKFVLDVDGNGWSGRFHRLMSSNSLVLKSTIFPEWYSERIQPWVHYVPIATDYRDLWTVMGFFRGDMEGRGEHDDIANNIAQQGKQWAAEYWRWEDMEAYFFRQILEYARVMERDPADWHSMDYDDSHLLQ
ncbi:hypothetical protein T439DRAFT_200763 [Meredithblackwellia eburnea MCA 4105]